MAKAAKKNPVSMTPDSEPEQAAVEAGLLDGSFSESNMTTTADVKSAAETVSKPPMFPPGTENKLETVAIRQSQENLECGLEELVDKALAMTGDDPVAHAACDHVIGQIMAKTGIQIVPVQVPIERIDRTAGGHLSMKVEVRMTHNQARALKGLYNALHGGGSRRANGQHVDKLSHAVQWLLDQLGA
jgi:hypothetical protein